jgi:ABC-type transporter Mla subunit MlaD
MSNTDRTPNDGVNDTAERLSRQTARVRENINRNMADFSLILAALRDRSVPFNTAADALQRLATKASGYDINEGLKS